MNRVSERAFETRQRIGVAHRATGSVTCRVRVSDGRNIDLLGKGPDRVDESKAPGEGVAILRRMCDRALQYEHFLLVLRHLPSVQSAGCSLGRHGLVKGFDAATLAWHAVLLGDGLFLLRPRCAHLRAIVL